MNNNFLTIDISDLMYQTTAEKVEKTLLKSRDKINQALTDSPVDILILTLVWESRDALCWKAQLQNFLSQLKTSYNNLKIIIIFNSWFKAFQLTFDEIGRAHV